MIRIVPRFTRCPPYLRIVGTRKPFSPSYGGLVLTGPSRNETPA